MGPPDGVIPAGEGEATEAEFSPDLPPTESGRHPQPRINVSVSTAITPVEIFFIASHDTPREDPDDFGSMKKVRQAKPPHLFEPTLNN